MFAGDFCDLLLSRGNFIELFLLIDQTVDAHSFVAVVALASFKHRDVNIIIQLIFLQIVKLTTHSKIIGMHISLHERPADQLALAILHNSLT